MLRAARSALVGAMAAGLALALGVSVGPAHADSAWSSPIKVMESSSNTQDPRIAVSSDGTKQFMVFRQDDNGHYRVKFSRSTDAGKTWTEPEWISEENVPANEPDVAVSSDGSVIMVTWIVTRPAGRNVEAITLTNGGATIGQQAHISGSDATEDPAVITMSDDGQRATIAWTGSNPNSGSRYVNAATTVNAGSTWTRPNQPISAINQEIRDADVASSSDGRKILVAWKQASSGVFRVLTSFSTDAGMTWSTPQTMFGNQTGDQLQPRVTSSDDGQTLHLLFVQESPSQTIPFLMSSKDGGSNWGTASPVNVLDLTNSVSDLVSSADGTHVAALLLSDPTNTKKAYVVSASSSDDWATTSLPAIMQFGVAYFTGAYSADGSTLAATWAASNIGASAVSASLSKDHGATWSDAKNFTVTDSLMMFPSVGVSNDGSLVALGWRNFTTPTTNKLFVAEYGTPGPVALSPTSADFGRVAIGNSGTAELTLTNVSAPMATISEIVPTGAGVSLSGGSCLVGGEIAFDASCTLDLSWNPTQVGNLANGAVTVKWNGQPNATATLSGTAVRGTQTLGSQVRFPKTIVAGRPTVLVRHSLSTSAGKAITSRVRCAARTLLPTGDARLCDVAVSKKGKVTVTASSAGTSVVLILTAPETKKFRPFAQTLRWTVKK